MNSENGFIFLRKGVPPNEAIYRSMLESLGLAGKQENLQTLVNRFVNETEMKNLNMNSSALHGAYMQAVAKSKQRHNEERMEESKIEHRPEIIYQVSFSCEDTCPKCSKIVMIEEIFAGWKRSFNDYVTNCPSCLQDYVPRFPSLFSLNVFEKSGVNPVSMESHSVVAMLMSPLILKKELDNIVNKNGEKEFWKILYDSNHKDLYWNTVFYLQLIWAPYFILEKSLSQEHYGSRMEKLWQEKISRNPNFDVNFDQNKIVTNRIEASKNS